ncbi:MAG: leucine-rich repeat domain-containing protein [Clostridia bacterium]|nr:leucine-rich repeat domain-containing protein [Clostridia bacterium]
MKNAVKVLIFVLAVVIIGAGAVYGYLNYAVSDFVYTDGAKNDTVQLNDYTGDEKEVEIPEKNKGKTVTSVAAETFLRSDITSVIIPDTVTVIEQKAFYECEELETVKMSENVKEIGEGAFINCRKLKSVRIPASLEKIEGAAFYGCENLTFEIAEGANFVYEDGVLYDKAKTTVYWVSGSKDLSSFTFPSSVTEFLPYVLSGHNELVTFTVPNGVKTIPDSMFVSCLNLETVIIPESVTAIGSTVFLGDSKLKEITLPRTVETIGKNNFPVKGKSDFVLKVYENSSAHFYAQENDINFEVIK